MSNDRKKRAERDEYEDALRQAGCRFRRKWWVFRPKFEYHVLADAVYWTDEFPIGGNSDWSLENGMRFVLNHRTSLLVGETGEYPRYWQIAQESFPRWIGFGRGRTTYNAEIADRIARIRRVSNWKVDRLMSELD